MNKKETGLTIVPQRKSAHLWEVLEWLEADHSSENFQSDDGNLILLDEPGSYCGFFIGLFVDQTNQGLQRIKRVSVEACNSTM